VSTDNFRPQCQTPKSVSDTGAELGKLVQQLVQEGDGTGQPVTPLLLDHLGVDAREQPILTEELHRRELPNLQLALDALFARSGWEARIIGLVGQARH
jgi:hypothetical protein